MNIKSIQRKDCCVYPGEFTPFYNDKAVKHSLHISNQIKNKKFKANVIDTTDVVIVEISIPGFSREDFHVEVNQNILSVFVINQQNSKSNQRNFKLHEFDNSGLEQHLILPANADASFVHAHYHQGILKLHFSKSEKRENNKCKNIVVY